MSEKNIIKQLWVAILIVFLFAITLTIGFMYLLDTTFEWDKSDFNFGHEVGLKAKLYNIDDLVEIGTGCYKYENAGAILCPDIQLRDSTIMGVVVTTDTSKLFYPIAYSEYDFLLSRTTKIGSDELQSSVFQLGALIEKLEEKEERENENLSGMRWMQSVLDVLKQSNRTNMRLLGSIQMFIYLFSMFAIALMIVDISFVVKNKKILGKFSFLNESLESTTYKRIKQVKEEIDTGREDFSFHSKYEPPIVFDTIEPCLDMLETYEGNINRGEFLSSVSTICNNVKEQIERRFQVLGYFVLTIPSLGFIGTVLGISEALGLTSRLTGNSPDYERVFANESLGQSLNIAFDTTLVGLIASIILSFALDWLETYEVNFTIDVKDKVIKRLSFIKYIGKI